MLPAGARLRLSGKPAYQLANVAFDPPPDKRVSGQCYHRRLNGRGRAPSSRWVSLSKFGKRAPDALTPGGIGYRCSSQGFLDEVQYFLLSLCGTLNRLHDEAMCGAAGFPGARAHA